MSVIEWRAEDSMKDFKDKTKEGTVVVDFYTSWCGPCRKLTPVLHELSSEFPNIKFYKINLDDCIEVGDSFDILSVPTVIILSNGIEKHRLEGPTKMELLDALTTF
jgi:thioredoxin 1